MQSAVKCNTYVQRVVMLTLIMAIVINVVMPPKQAHANPFEAALGLEIGALIFWGGAALVATCGVAIGLDDELMDDVEQFGRDTFYGANDLIKDQIKDTLSTSIGVAGVVDKIKVKFPDETQAYLEAEFNKKFGEKGYKINAAGEVTISKAASPAKFPPAGTPAENLWPHPEWQYQMLVYNYPPAGVDRPIYQYWYRSQHPLDVAIPTGGSNQVNVRNVATWPDTINNRLYPYEYSPDGSGWGPAANGQNYNQGSVVINPTWVDGAYNNVIAWANFSVYYENGTLLYGTYQPFTYAGAMPREISIPIPRGAVDTDGKPIVTVPTIGRVGGVTTGDVAIGYTGTIGAVKELTAADSIAATATPPGGGTGPPKAPSILALFLDMLRAILMYIYRLFMFILTLPATPSQPLTNPAMDFLLQVHIGGGNNTMGYFGGVIPINVRLLDLVRTMITIIMSFSVYKVLRKFFNG